METRTYEREKLYREIWAEPMITVAKRYGISDVALRRHCKKLDIPLPKQGHWAKVQAGHKVKVPPLPRSKGPDKTVVFVNDTYRNLSPGLKASDRLLFLPEEEREVVKEYCAGLTVPSELSKLHSLVADTKQYYRARKESTKPPVNRVINITVSDEQRERVYTFYSTIFTALEHLGYSVTIKAPKSDRYYNYDPIVKDNKLHVCLGEDSVEIRIKEKIKQTKHIPTEEDRNRYSIPAYDYENTGRLHFIIESSRAARKNWRDTETKRIEDKIGEIVIWVMEAIEVEKNRRLEWEAKRIQREKEELLRQQIAEKKENEQKKLELLEKYAGQWDKAQHVRRFVDSVELKLGEIENQEQREKLVSWIQWAREKADWLDPMTDKHDEVLGRGNWILDVIVDGED